MPTLQPILYVIDSFKDPNAGTEGQLYQIIKYLDRQKYLPELLVFSDSPWLKEAVFPCQVHVLGHSSLSSPKMWLALAKFAKSFSAKGGRLAHVFFNDSSIICPPVFYLFGIKTLISRRDMGYWYTRTNKALLNFTRLFTAGAAVNSHAVADVTCKAEGFKRSDVHVIYNGYEADSGIHNNIAELEKIRSKGRLVLTLVANIRPIKRISDVIQAISLLKQQSVLVDFVHIGEGESSELKALAQTLGIGEQVHFLGKRSDVKDCLQYMDIGLLCSESEGFSNAIVEYLRQGLPVICSDVGGNGEAVTDGETGYLYPCADVTALANSIKILVTDEVLRKEMGRKAKHSALKRFSVEAMTGQYVSLYQSL